MEVVEAKKPIPKWVTQEFKRRKRGKLKKTLEAVPKEMWQMVFSMMQDNNTRINFTAALIEYHALLLPMLQNSLGFFLFEGYPSIQKIFLLDRTERDRLLDLLKGKLREKKVFTAEDTTVDTELKNEFNTLITDTPPAWLETGSIDTVTLHDIAANLAFARGSDDVIEMPHNRHRRECRTIILPLVSLPIAGCLFALGYELAQHHHDNIGVTLIILSVALPFCLAVSSALHPIRFNCTPLPAARSYAARLGNSLTRCFRNCRQAGEPEQIELVSEEESGNVQIALNVDPTQINNNNNDYDPLAANDPNSREMLRKTNRPG